jgi:hypothetical protein
MKRAQIALVVAGVAALAGGGTAIAAKGHSQTVRTQVSVLAGKPGPMRGGLDAAATYLGTTVAALQTQLAAGKTLAQIADATSGTSASGLIAALVADAKAKLGANVPSDLTQHVTDLVDGVRDRHGPGGFGGPGHGGLLHDRGAPHLGAAATYLGVTADGLRTQLQSGKTLAEIANATSGKSAQGLIDALVADARAHITKLVNGSG